MKRALYILLAASIALLILTIQAAIIGWDHSPSWPACFYRVYAQPDVNGASTVLIDNIQTNVATVTNGPVPFLVYVVAAQRRGTNVLESARTARLVIEAEQLAAPGRPDVR